MRAAGADRTFPMVKARKGCRECRGIRLSASSADLYVNVEIEQLNDMFNHEIKAHNRLCKLSDWFLIHISMLK